MTASRPSNRIEQLDGIRALAIGLVFLNHLFRVKLAWAGVDLFFILSGFLITGILLGNKGHSIGGYFHHFYSRRIRRILPPYLLLLLITPIFAGWAWLRVGYLYLFLMNFVTAFKLPHPSSHDILWSLAVEEQFYLFWPIVIFLLSETGVAWCAAALVILAPALRFFCTPLFPDYAPVYMLTPFRMDLLAAGALLAILWRRRRDLIERFGIFGPVLTVLALAALFFCSRLPRFNLVANQPFANLWIYEFTLLASLGIVLWALGGRWVGILKWAWVRYLGRISYTFYLIHTTVQLAVLHYRPEPPHHHWQTALITLPITLLYSALSWQYLEKPILYGRRKTPLRKQALADERAITHRT